MYTIDFNIPFKDLNQTVVDNGNKKLASVLSEVIGSAAKVENPMKFYGWHIELSKSGKLVLDDADKKLLYGFIESNENIFVFVKGQLLTLIDSAVSKK